MKKDRRADARRPANGAAAQYVLRLYVAGLSPRSRHAIANLTSLCEEHLAGRYDLEVIDVFKRPLAAREEQIIATPTLVKKTPPPVRRLIGDLSKKEKVFVGLDLAGRS